MWAMFQFANPGLTPDRPVQGTSQPRNQTHPGQVGFFWDRWPHTEVPGWFQPIITPIDHRYIHHKHLVKPE